MFDMNFCYSIVNYEVYYKSLQRQSVDQMLSDIQNALGGSAPKKEVM